MEPYFEDHSAGWLFLLVVVCFFAGEMIQFFRQRAWRKQATRIATPGFWAGVVIWVIVATVILHRAGHYVPAAAMGHGALVFAVGMMLLLAGAGLRSASPGSPCPAWRSSCGASTSRKPRCYAPPGTATASTPNTTNDSYPSSGETLRTAPTGHCVG